MPKRQQTTQAGWRIDAWRKPVGNVVRSTVYNWISQGRIRPDELAKIGGVTLITISPEDFIEREREKPEL